MRNKGSSNHVQHNILLCKKKPLPSLSNRAIVAGPDITSEATIPCRVRTYNKQQMLFVYQVQHFIETKYLQTRHNKIKVGLVLERISVVTTARFGGGWVFLLTLHIDLIICGGWFPARPRTLVVDFPKFIPYRHWHRFREWVISFRRNLNTFSLCRPENGLFLQDKKGKR